MTGNTATRNPDFPLTNPTPGGRHELLVVAEGLHVLNRQTCAAITDRDRERLLSLARKHLACGAEALAINLGPSRAMTDLTPWVTETLRQELAVPLFLSANALAFPELLRRHGHNLTINAVTADPAGLPSAMTTANECGTGLVVLLVRPGLTPAGSADRLAIAAEVIDQALRLGFPLQHLYLDPLLTLRPDPLAWRISRGMPDLTPVVETIVQLRLLDDSLRTIVALGNCSGVVESNGRTALQARVLAVLIEAGLDAIILNGQDHSLLRACHGLASGELPGDAIFRAA
jgi:5-methyltetrahydrofolate corrinoid/iron sulfur protein methyltransferase